MSSHKNREDEIYEKGVQDGQKADSLDQFSHNLAKGYTLNPRENDIYNKGYAYGVAHPQREREKGEQNERRSSSGGGGSSSGGGAGGGDNGCAVLIGILIVVAVVVWFIFAVAIPLLVVNIAVIALIIAVLRKQVSKFLLPLSVAGAALVVADYNQGWFTKALAGNVPFLARVIPALLYLNIFAGLIAAYFLIRNFMNKRSPQAENAGEFTRRNVITMGSLLLGAALVYGGMTLYKSIVTKTSLTFAFSLDGKGLSNFQTPEVKVDGQLFGSGNRIKPGRHQIAVQLANTEPLEQRFWFFYGEKNLGTLPLESSKGSLALTVNPAPAIVILKRQDEIVRQGNAPLKIDKLSVGDYSVVVHRDEYEEIHSIKIQRQQLTESKIELNLGSVSLSSDPADAEFDLSGNRRHWQGKLPMRIDDVPVGNYSLFTRRKGWELPNTNVSVSRGNITTNKTEFPYGSIEVTSEPSGLLVSTNGVEISKTPAALHDLRPGLYTLTATDGENDIMADVSVGPKEVAKTNFVFRYATVQLASIPAGASVIRKGKEAGKTPLKLERIPAGEVTVGLKLDGYVTTNFVFHVVESETANLLTAKLISVRYLEAMKQARAAFDSGQLAESKQFVGVALESEPDDTSAMRLRAEVSTAEKKAEIAQNEAEDRVNRANEEARRKEFAEQAAQKRKDFENALSKIAENEFFEIHTREFPYSLETVWQAATTVIGRKDKNAVGNASTGVIWQKFLYKTPSKGVLDFLGNGDYRTHKMLIMPIGRETTRVELKLFNYESVDSPNGYAQMKTQNGQPYKFIQDGIFTWGLVLDKDLVRRRAAEFFDEVEKSLSAKK